MLPPRKKKLKGKKLFNVWPGSSDPYYIVNYYIKWVTTSWTHSSLLAPWEGNAEYSVLLLDGDS